MNDDFFKNCNHPLEKFIVNFICSKIINPNNSTEYWKTKKFSIGKPENSFALFSKYEDENVYVRYFSDEYYDMIPCKEMDDYKGKVCIFKGLFAYNNDIIKKVSK